ncbi:MAG: DNA polymerase III subunit chi [Hyphomicrobiaceae bacterium]
MADPVTEVLFYHLERHPLERVLPGLLERTLDRGWRAIVQAGSPERLAALDSHLWTYRDESFLPHGTVKDGPPALQPILLTLEEDNPNDAGVRFLVDGATLQQFAGYIRVVVIFDGADRTAVQSAREMWTTARGQGCTATYWQQTESGGWDKRA